MTIVGNNFDPSSGTVKVWVGGLIASLPRSSPQSPSALVVALPSAPQSARQNTWLQVQVESRQLNATVAPQLLSYGGAPIPASSSNSKWGMSIDELALLILLMVVLVAVLLGLQLLWCLSRFAGVRLACMERCCPRLVRAHQEARGEKRGGGGDADEIHLGLLQHDHLGLDAAHAQPAGAPMGAAYRPPSQPAAPYTPAAAAHFAVAPPAAQPAPAYHHQPAHYLSPAIAGYPLSVSPTAEGVAQPHILYPRSFVPSPHYYQ